MCDKIRPPKATARRRTATETPPQENKRPKKKPKVLVIKATDTVAEVAPETPPPTPNEDIASKTLATTSAKGKTKSKKVKSPETIVRWKTPGEKKEQKRGTVSKEGSDIEDIPSPKYEEIPSPKSDTVPEPTVEIEIPISSSFTYTVKHLKVSSQTQTDNLSPSAKATQTKDLEKPKQTEQGNQVKLPPESEHCAKLLTVVKETQTHGTREPVKLTKETQTEAHPEPIRYTKATQTDIPKETPRQSESTQTEVVVCVNQGVQTENVVDSPDASEGIRPYHPQHFEGVRLTDVFILYPFYEAIEVVDEMPWTVEMKKKFPTKWITIISPYWDQFRGAADQYDLTESKKCVSWLDDAVVWVQEVDHHLYAVRNGFKVIIRYPNGGTGGRYRYAPLQEMPPEQPDPFLPRQCGVPVAFIPPDCPYWHYLLEKMTFSSTRGFTKSETSIFDQRRYQVLIEKSGQVEVVYQGRKYRLREASPLNR